MESINLGAVLFGILLLLWLTYALPRTAARREVMGRARAAEKAEMTPQARDLSAAVHARRTSAEVTSPMSQDRLLMRPADPTRRPRFDASPGTRIEPPVERDRSRRLLRVVLAVLIVATALLVGLAVAQVVAWWVPLLGVAGLAVYLVGLRRAELERRARATQAASRARQERAERETARLRAEGRSRGALAAKRPSESVARAEETRGADETPSAAAVATAASAVTARTAAATTSLRADIAVRPVPDLEAGSERAAAQVTRPGEWTPRPVPRPTYALRGEVDDLGTRHAMHRRSVMPATTPLESGRVEELEAIDESFAPAQDLGLDEVLARRRA